MNPREHNFSHFPNRTNHRRHCQFNTNSVISTFSSTFYLY